jgi:uncharacterized protein (TIGR03083 family)
MNSLLEAPVDLRPVYARLEHELVRLLRGLTLEDWERPTICAGWRVKDVAAHLLDTHLRKLSMGRDGYFGERAEGVDSYQGLVAFLDRLNADWVKAARRLSPAVLVDLLERTSQQAIEHDRTLDLRAPARFSVAWAGEEQSAVWFDIAREYTERWHHQAQIRLAVEKPGLHSREFYHPVLDTFLRALPHHYRAMPAAEGTSVRIVVSGDAGGTWPITRRGGTWVRGEGPGTPAAVVTLPGEIAWRVFTKGIAHDEARRQSKIEGDATLGAHLFSMLSVMASERGGGG